MKRKRRMTHSTCTHMLASFCHGLGGVLRIPPQDAASASACRLASSSGTDLFIYILIRDKMKKISKQCLIEVSGC